MIGRGPFACKAAAAGFEHSRARSADAPLFAILFVAHFFHPINDFAIEIFCNGDVRHGRGGRSAVPMLFAGRKPNNVAGADFFHGSVFALRPAATGCDNESLAQRMRMPCGSRAGLERDACAGDAGRRGRLEQWIDAHCAGEPVCRALVGWL